MIVVPSSDPWLLDKILFCDNAGIHLLPFFFCRISGPQFSYFVCLLILRKTYCFGTAHYMAHPSIVASPGVGLAILPPPYVYPTSENHRHRISTKSVASEILGYHKIVTYTMSIFLMYLVFFYSSGSDK